MRVMDKVALADFLRRRRAALQPVDIGIDRGRRRQTVGLRRDEVANLAHVSTDHYRRMEQARGSRPSPEATRGLARALRLTPAERDHLYRIAGHTPPPRTYRPDFASLGLSRVLARIDTPAQIVSDLGVTLAQNLLARALVGDQTTFVGPNRSVVHRWFTEPSARAVHPDDEHPRISRAHVAALRAVYGATRDDLEAQELVALLLGRSEEFALLWERHEVVDRSGSVKRYLNPLVGEMTLDCQILTADNVTERLVVFTPMTGDDAAKLDLLAVASNQQVEQHAPQTTSQMH